MDGSSRGLSRVLETGSDDHIGVMPKEMLRDVTNQRIT
jgi:hypothetical protein